MKFYKGKIYLLKIWTLESGKFISEIKICTSQEEIDHYFLYMKEGFIVIRKRK